ncbi:MAG: RDD family protein [Pseudomonadota bacterium]
MSDHVKVGSATGVDVKLDIAGPGARSFGFVIDWHIRVLFALAWVLAAHWLFVGSMTWIDEESMDVGHYLLIVWVPAVAIYALYHPVLEIAMKGRTPGKRMAGVRIVDEDAQEPSVMALLVRNVLRILDSLPFGYVVGLTATVVTKNSVRIGDLAAGTLLVFDSGQRAMDSRSLGVDIATMGQHGVDRTELAQDLMDRWHTLDIAKRQALAARLITAIDATITPSNDDDELKTQLASLFSPTDSVSVGV